MNQQSNDEKDIQSRPPAEARQLAEAQQPAEPLLDQEQAQNQEDQETVKILVKKRVRGKKRQQTKKKGMSLAGKIALIALVALVALALVGVAVVKHGLSKAESDLHATPEEQVQTIEYNGKTYAYNENVVSILLLGLDDESSTYYQQLGLNRSNAKCSDANLLVTMDTKTNDVRVIAIPRDTQVDVDLYVGGKHTVTKPLQLCLAYSTDCGSEAKCAQNSARSVSRILKGQPINYYCALNYDAVISACNALGGVTLTALESIPGTHIAEGEEVLLQGDNAMRYLQYRDSNVDGSAMDRLERQKQFIGAFFAQLKGKNASKLLDVFNAVSADVNTNLGAAELGYLASCVAANTDIELNVIDLKGKIKLMKDDDGEEREHVFLKDKSVMDAVVECFYTPVE